MSTRSVIKKTAEVIMYGKLPFGIMKHAPQGLDLYFDLRKYQPDFYPKVVFDVGANIGQTVMKWSKFFPKAQYYCFEPVRATMETLKKNTAASKNIRYYQCALGAEKGQAEIAIFDDSSLNSFVNPLEENAKEKEIVQIKALDSICQAEGIGYIDFLKIDTEGFDIEVLKGATSMLKDSRVTFIQVEAGMIPQNKLHAPFQAFVDYLTPFGYILFGIYEQRLEWTGEKRLSYTNPVFISEKYT